MLVTSLTIDEVGSLIPVVSLNTDDRALVAWISSDEVRLEMSMLEATEVT